MNNYPLWWDTTLTIYNKYEDPLTQLITWYKTTLDHCFWKYTGDKVAIGNTILETNNTICRIPQNPIFLERYEWEQLPTDQKPNFFTLGIGDLIFKGAIEDIIDEYHSPHRSNDIIAKYKNITGCITIERVAINVGVGRNNPHYYVKGV